jgi:hypothetical protein
VRDAFMRKLCSIIIIAILRAAEKFEACKISANAHVNANFTTLHELSLHCHVRSMCLLFPFLATTFLNKSSCPDYKRNIKTSLMTLELTFHMFSALLLQSHIFAQQVSSSYSGLCSHVTSSSQIQCSHIQCKKAGLHCLKLSLFDHFCRVK